jgi:hypothetical protein
LAEKRVKLNRAIKKHVESSGLDKITEIRTLKVACMMMLILFSPWLCSPLDLDPFFRFINPIHRR